MCRCNQPRVRSNRRLPHYNVIVPLKEYLMSEKLTLFERLANRVFAIPAIAQLWARQKAGQTRAMVEQPDAIPFSRLTKPLAACKVALVTTSGIHLPHQAPFDMENPDGDASFRPVPGDTQSDAITITHKYYDHSDADADLNVVFPLEHFRALVKTGIIGALATTHYGFMGHIDGEQVTILNEGTAPTVAASLRAEGVDFVFLTPA